MSVVLVTHHAKCMCCIIFLSVACLALPYFFALSHKLHHFWGKKFIKHKMHVLIFSTPFVRNILILWRIQWAIIINLHTSSCKVLVILVRFEWNFNFLHRFFKNTQISNLMKICPVEARCSMRKDGQAERHDEANSCFSQFCECAWLWSYSCVCVCVWEREREIHKSQPQHSRMSYQESL